MVCIAGFFGEMVPIACDKEFLHLPSVKEYGPLERRLTELHYQKITTCITSRLILYPTLLVVNFTFFKKKI